METVNDVLWSLPLIVIVAVSHYPKYHFLLHANLLIGIGSPWWGSMRCPGLMTVRTDIRFDVSQGRAQVYSEDGNLWNKLMRKCLVLWCSRTDKCRLNCCLL